MLDCWLVLHYIYDHLPAAGHRCPLTSTKLHCFIIKVPVCEKLVQRRYIICNSRETNLQSLDCKFHSLTTMPTHHTVITVTISLDFPNTRVLQTNTTSTVSSTNVFCVYIDSQAELTWLSVGSDVDKLPSQCECRQQAFPNPRLYTS